MRLVGGAGLDSLHLLGLDGVVGQAEEEEERRHREGYGTAASPLERDHHGSVVNVHVCSCSYISSAAWKFLVTAVIVTLSVVRHMELLEAASLQRKIACKTLSNFFHSSFVLHVPCALRLVGGRS